MIHLSRLKTKTIIGSSSVLRDELPDMELPGTEADALSDDKLDDNDKRRILIKFLFM